MKKTLSALTALILLTPVAAWAFYRPIRVLAPGWVDGVVCVTSEICLEEESRYPEAEALYHEAANHVASVVGSFRHNPRVIFCSTNSCYQAFGFAGSAASTVGRSGIVVSPRGWKGYYLRHEMIHHRQAEELGMFAALLKPEWLIEGMAYALSSDPRQALSPRWQQDREAFSDWFEQLGQEGLWNAAKRI